MTQVIYESSGVESTADVGMGADSLERRRHNDFAPAITVEERVAAEGVAKAKDFAAPAIHQNEGEASAQARKDARSMLVISGGGDVGVGAVPSAGADSVACEEAAPEDRVAVTLPRHSH
jgi:hypothetical protein